MPCLHPITIQSPESRFLKKCKKENRPFEYYFTQSKQRRNILFDPVPLVDNPHDYYSLPSIPLRLMQVPCGKCPLCLKSRIDGYFVRCWYEYLHTILACKGSAWFITLTYADDILPKERPLNVDEDSGEILGFLDPVPCFSKRHVQLFLKRFRKYSCFDLKYFIVTEFGGEFGRPHYHAIFFIKNFESTDLNRIYLTNLIANSWTKLNDRNYKYQSMREYNLFDVQRVDVQPLKDSKQIRYCCKYVGKQFGATDFDKLHLDSDNKRFHLQSIDLGANIYDYCDPKDFESGFISVDGYKYSIPLYYKTKLMREYYCEHENGSIIYRPSNYALQYLENLCEVQIREHKNLAILNSDYPRLSDAFYNPSLLSRFLDSFSSYSFSRSFDTPFVCAPELQSMFFEYVCFLQDVQKYNQSAFEAKSNKWQRQQLDHYQKKTKRK